MPSPYPIRYPRRVLRRRLMRAAGRLALRLFSDTVVTGIDHVPARGPLLVVGNHVDMLEAAMMGLFVPRLIEVIGAGDIPLDARYAWLIHLYGYIPINRGNIDRQALTAALGVLAQGGVIGLFPEGGIWEDGSKQARTGVAWLSQKAQAPIVPVGFGGMRGAIGKLVRFEHPRLTVNVGAPLPPVSRGVDRRAGLEDAANDIMRAVEALVPEHERWLHAPGIGEQFDFDARLTRPDGSTQGHYDDFSPEERAALSRLLHRPVLLDALRRNCKLPVAPLERYATTRDPAQIAQATAAILDYLDTTNPQFFNYRLGYADGGAVADGLRTLHRLAQHAAQANAQLTLTASRRVEVAESATIPGDAS